MEKRNKLAVGVIVLILIVGLAIGGYFTLRSPWKYRGDGPIKILWVNSYDQEFQWSLDQMEGFEDSFKKDDLDYEVKILDMDTKNNESEEWIEQKIKEVEGVIDNWSPDVVFATDDNTMKYNSVSYDSSVPWVFSGVNGEVEDYGYENSENLAGVLQREAVVPTLELMKTLYPYASKVGVVVEKTISGDASKEYVQSQVGSVDGLEFVEWYSVADFEEYKTRINEFNEKVDVIFILIITGLKDESGTVIGKENVIKWTVQNSNIPEMSLWDVYIEEGVLLSVVITGQGEGFKAGELAKRILIDGENPSSLEMGPSNAGVDQINTARAEQLDLQIPSIILINSEVVEEFPWEEE